MGLRRRIQPVGPAVAAACGDADLQGQARADGGGGPELSARGRAWRSSALDAVHGHADAVAGRARLGGADSAGTVPRGEGHAQQPDVGAVGETGMSEA